MLKPKTFPKIPKTNFEYQKGESIETKVRRIVENNEPIKDGAPIIYTNREDGVLPGYNIRTDRWEIAQQTMDAIAQQNLAKSKQFGLKKEINALDSENNPQQQESVG